MTSKYRDLMAKHGVRTTREVIDALRPYYVTSFDMNFAVSDHRRTAKAFCGNWVDAALELLDQHKRGADYEEHSHDTSIRV